MSEMRDTEIIVWLNRMGYVVLKDSRHEGYFNIEKNGNTRGPYSREKLIQIIKDESDQYW